MSKRVVIAGAGGFGRAVYGWLSGSLKHLVSQDVTDIAFIDDGLLLVEPQVPVVSTIYDYAPQPEDVVLCAIGNPAVRRSIVQRLWRTGSTFHTFVDDRAIIGSRAVIGEGAIICPGVVLSADVVVGDHVNINFNCSVGHDTVLGAYTTLSPAVNIMGQVAVGESVFFGGSAVVLPRLSVGTGAVVGAGATIVRSVDRDVTVVGNPAVPLCKGSLSR